MSGSRSITSVCFGLFPCQKIQQQSAGASKVGGAEAGWGVGPLLEPTRSLHRSVLVGRCPEQLDSGLASNRQHVLAPGAARPHRSRMLAANQSSAFQHPPPSQPRAALSPVNPSPAARPRRGNPGLEVTTGHGHVHVPVHDRLEGLHRSEDIVGMFKCQKLIGEPLASPGSRRSFLSIRNRLELGICCSSCVFLMRVDLPDHR